MLQRWFFSCFHGFWVTDVVTSWCHVMTSQNLNYLSQLRDVLESWFFFVSMDSFVVDFKNIIKFLIVRCRDVMTSCHSVAKPDLPKSQLLNLEMCWKVDFFLFPWIFGQRVQKFYQYYQILILWCRDVDVMLWHHNTWFIIYLACRCPRKMIIFCFHVFFGITEF